MKYIGKMSARNLATIVFSALSILSLLALSALPAQAALTGGVRITGIVQNGPAQPSDFTLEIRNGNSSVSASGNTIIFDGLNAGVTYTISKTEGPGGYSVMWSGDCSAQGTITIIPSITRNCTATYVFGPVGTLRVNTVINGGTALATDFTVHLKKSGQPDTGSPSGSGSVVTFNNLVPGGYTVIQSPPPPGYTVSFSGACDSAGNVTVVGNATVTCTITDKFTSGGGSGGSGGSDRPNRPAPTRPGR